MDPGQIAGQRGSRRVVGVQPQGDLGGQDGPESAGRLIDRMRVCGTACVLDAEAVHPNARRQNPAPHIDVVVRRVDSVRSEGESHHRNHGLVVHSRVHNGPPRGGQIPDIVHEVEVPVHGGARPRHESCLQCQGLGRLRGKGHPRYRARQDLQICLRANGGPHGTHRVEGAGPHIEVGSLKQRATPEFEVADAGLGCGLHGGEDILKAHLAAEDTLKSIPKGSEHDPHGPGSRCL